MLADLFSWSCIQHIRRDRNILNRCGNELRQRPSFERRWSTVFRLAWDDLSVDLIVSRPWNDFSLPQLRRPSAAVSVSPAGSLALSQAETLATSVSAVGRAGCRETTGAENCLFVIERDDKDLRTRIGLFDFRLFHHRLFERD